MALVSDIHGNLVALDAVMKSIEVQRPDKLVSLGDVFATGPNPHEVIQKLRERNALCVIGNHEDSVLRTDVEARGEEPAVLREVDSWCYKQLTDTDQSFLRTFRPTLEIRLSDQITMLAFHGSPRSPYEFIGTKSSEEELEVLLSGRNAQVLAGGHTHRQILRRCKDMILINPGSVGLPVERHSVTGKAWVPPWAEYAMVGCEGGELFMAFERVPVDQNRVDESILTSGMPHKESFLNAWKSVIDGLIAAHNLN